LKLITQLSANHLKLFLISFIYLQHTKQWILVRFCVDTGANVCIMSEKDRIRMGLRRSDLKKLKKGNCGIGGKVDVYEAKQPITVEFISENGTYTFEFQKLKFMRGRTKSAREVEKIMPSILGIDFIMDHLKITNDGQHWTIETRNQNASESVPVI